MFQKILIANRSEIAVRIMRTCREMGIKTVAVYSEADRYARHVLEADECVLIGEAEPGASYLRVDRLIEAAKETGAEAIHPGYGFLSERAEFADACKEAGITWIGPPGEVIEKLGDKLIARQIMQEHDIPLTPGRILEGTNIDDWKTQADELGYPLLIKAAAGGGGKGMRIVRESSEFASACKMAASEAKSAFGDDRVYLERYVEEPRHIEFQILADNTGKTLHLFERECSIQRRHQKIIEETPSPILDEALRAEMGEAAVKAVQAVKYVNAGTVEFLFDPSTKEFYFLEVNTRLQVEHPITEMLTGLDLVRWQLEIAAGKELPFEQKDLTRRGHAFECRIYAEDPANNFAPSPGKITYMKAPSGPGIRHDSGVYSGYDIPMYYDPILAKLITYGATREEARQRMLNALKEYVLLGIKNPLAFLIDVFEHEAFIKGDMSTHFIKQHMEDWQPAMPDEDLACIAYVLDELLPKGAAGFTGTAQQAEGTPSPWQTLGGWRIGQS